MSLNSKTKSILSEIFDTKEKADIKLVENRADHVLTSVFNFFTLIEESNWTPEEKEDVTKRFLHAIKKKDKGPFFKKIGKMEKKHD